METFSTKDGRLTISYDGREHEPLLVISVNSEERDLLRLSSFSGGQAALIIENIQ